MKRITDHDLVELGRRAASARRRRVNVNLHPRLDDPVQRFVNAVEPDSYVRPHRHPDAGRWELFIAIAGRALVLTFTPLGRVLERVELAAAGPAHAVEIPAGEWHAVAALARGTVLFEVKPGPYMRTDDKDFAKWAPEEGSPAAALMVQWYAAATPGDEPPPMQ